MAVLEKNVRKAGEQSMTKQNYMGFDDFIYVVRVKDEDGQNHEYEFGNLGAAIAQYELETIAEIAKYKDSQEYSTSYKKTGEVSHNN